jgi:hypothetical protein
MIRVRDLRSEATLRGGRAGGRENGLGFGEGARRVGAWLIYVGGAGRPLVLVGWAGC